MAPPVLPDELAVNVDPLRVTVAEAPKWSAPPTPVAVLLDIVTFVNVTVVEAAEVEIAPPAPAVLLPLSTTPFNVKLVEAESMAPPLLVPVTSPPDNVKLLMVSSEADVTLNIREVAVEPEPLLTVKLPAPGPLIIKPFVPLIVI
jgi:hypothetical protein